jgi:hypothetical protein
VPVNIVSKLYKFNTKELLKLLFDHITFKNNSTVKLDLSRLQKWLDEKSRFSSNILDFNQPESGIIKTSYMFQDIDYDVTIKYPFLEYQNPYKNAIISRSLIYEEDFQTFFQTPILLSTDWPAVALKCFTNFSQFNIFISGKRQNPALSQFHSPIKTLQMKESSIFSSQADHR